MIQWWWLIIEFVVLVLVARAIPALLLVCIKRAHIKREKEDANTSFVAQYQQVIAGIGKDLQDATGINLGYTGTGSQPGGVSFTTSPKPKRRIVIGRDKPSA